MNKIYTIIIVILIFVLGLYYFMNKENSNNYENIYLAENIIEIENRIEEISTIKVHIIGEVINPGVYEIENGARINDVIKVAGGNTVNADLNKINLAYEVFDGEKIYIPSIFDEEDEYTLSSEEKRTFKVNINKASAEDLQNINGIGPALANKIIAYREENGKFKNIEELKNVSGIGEKKYEDIVQYIVVK